MNLLPGLNGTDSYGSYIRKIRIAPVLGSPVAVAVVGYAHRIETAASKRRPEILVAGGRGLQEVAADGDAAAAVRIMEVVIRDSEGIVAGTQSPVPVFLFSAASAVKFHQTVAA